MFATVAGTRAITVHVNSMATLVCTLHCVFVEVEHSLNFVMANSCDAWTKERTCFVTFW